MRLRPASSAAAEKREYDRVTSGKPSDVLVKRTSLVRKKPASTVAAAALNVLWPDVYDGNGGVVSSGVQSRSSESTSRMACTGRQTLNLYLQSQQPMPASARAKLSSANRRAFSAIDVPRSAATVWAMRFQWPGG